MQVISCNTRVVNNMTAPHSILVSTIHHTTQQHNNSSSTPPQHHHSQRQPEKLSPFQPFYFSTILVTCLLRLSLIYLNISLLYVNLSPCLFFLSLSLSLSLSHWKESSMGFNRGVLWRCRSLFEVLMGVVGNVNFTCIQHFLAPCFNGICVFILSKALRFQIQLLCFKLYKG